MLQLPGWNISLRKAIVSSDELAKLLPDWEDLSTRCVEDNVYYSPRYAQALLAGPERSRHVRFAVVWEETKLIAMLPFTRPALPLPFLRPAGQAWQSLYTFGCMPLLDRARSKEAADALLDILATVGAGGWALPAVNTNGEAARAMIAALARRGLPSAFVGHFERATLEAGATFEEHMQAHVKAKRRRDLARNRRRLEALGRLDHESHRSGEGLRRAVAAFLDIEARGWKGRRGTALACDGSARAFAMAAFTGEEASSICRADMLTLDGVPIAVGLTAIAGSTGFTVKCAYDEAYGSYGAGLLLEVEAIRSFLSERWASRLDSATAGTHVVDSLWPGRTEVADLLFVLSPRHPAPRLAALKGVDRARRSMRAGAKAFLKRTGRFLAEAKKRRGEAPIAG